MFAAALRRGTRMSGGKAAAGGLHVRRQSRRKCLADAKTGEGAGAAAAGTEA
jgi:hypothetical protein